MAEQTRETPPPLRAPRRLPVGARVVLLLGFGGVLALMAVAEADSVRVLGRIETRNAEISRRFLTENHILEHIRSSLYLSTTYARDYLLEPDPGAASRHLSGFKELQSGIEQDLNRYAGLLSPADAGSLESLRRRLQRYWDSLAPAFAWAPPERRNRGYAFLTGTVIPHRMQVLQAADEIASMNEEQLRRSNRRSAELFRNFRRRMALVLTLTLSLGALLAWFSIARTLELEREAQLRFQEIQRTRDELEHLSERLLDAQEDERRRISRELHDEVGQSLTAMMVDLGNTAAGIPPELDEPRARLTLVRKAAEQVLSTVRNMALLLRPSMLDDFGLVPALHWQAREMFRRTGIHVAVSADDVPDELPDEERTCIYRVVQEALHNCLRHAGARTVQVVVRPEPDRILLVIQDDGRGFDTRSVRGLGLLGMEERVRRLGGSFEVQSEPGKGTLLRVELPQEGADIAVGYERDTNTAGG